MAAGGSGGGGGSGFLCRLLLALLAGLLSGGPAQARLHHLTLKVGGRGGAFPRPARSPQPHHPQPGIPSAWYTQPHHPWLGCFRSLPPERPSSPAWNPFYFIHHHPQLNPIRLVHPNPIILGWVALGPFYPEGHHPQPGIPYISSPSSSAESHQAGTLQSHHPWLGCFSTVVLQSPSAPVWNIPVPSYFARFLFRTFVSQQPSSPADFLQVGSSNPIIPNLESFSAVTPQSHHSWLDSFKIVIPQPSSSPAWNLLRLLPSTPTFPSPISLGWYLLVPSSTSGFL